MLYADAIIGLRIKGFEYTEESTEFHKANRRPNKTSIRWRFSRYYFEQ